MKNLYSIFLFLIICACISQEERLNNSKRICTSYGYKEPSTKFSDCLRTEFNSAATVDILGIKLRPHSEDNYDSAGNNKRSRNIWIENRDGQVYSCNDFGGSVNCHQ